MLQHVRERPELNPQPLVESEKVRSICPDQVKGTHRLCNQAPKLQSPPPAAWYHLISWVWVEGVICPMGAPDKQIPAP